MISQRELSEISGVSKRMIEQYESGERDINHAQVMTVYKLSRALNVNIEKLLELVEDQKMKKKKLKQWVTKLLCSIIGIAVILLFSIDDFEIGIPFLLFIVSDLSVILGCYKILEKYA